MQRKSRKLSKKEKVVIVVLVAAMAVGWGAYQWYMQRRAADRAAFEQSQNQEFSMGETVHLDAEQDENTVNTDSLFDTEGVPYISGLAFRGTMDVTVQNATLYDTPAAAGLDETNLVEPGMSGYPLLLVEVSLKNVDAEPAGSSNSGKDWFNVSFLNLSSAGPPNYFDGTPEGANASEGFDFELGKGQERAFRLGWFVDPDNAEHPFDKLALGASSDKLTVQLDVQDLRGGDSQ